MLVRSTLIFLFGGFLQVTVTQNDFGLKVSTEKQRIKNSTQYLFQYYVKDDATGDYKTQQETKNGDSVKGTYSIADPNGDLRTVTYEAGSGKGFEAKVNIVSDSPIKPTAGDIASTVAKRNGQRESDETDSKVNHFPGGFVMNILSKPHLNNKKSEIRMKFSMALNNATEPFVEAVTDNATTAFKNKHNSTVTNLENTSRTTLKNFFNSRTIEIEKTTLEPFEKEINQDPVEKQINEAMNSMPKIPELVFSDNKTHLKFFKDPEEALIDERISQIARQLAETSLRREYEEQKLGHFIPISLKPIEPSPSTDFSKSLKFTGTKIPYFRPTHFPDTYPVQIPIQIAAVKIIPEYIYRETYIPNVPLVPNGMSLDLSTSRPKNLDKQITTKITESSDILKVINTNKSLEEEINKISKINENVLTTVPQPIAIVPLQIPTLLRVFSPIEQFVLPMENKQQEPQLFISSLLKDSTPGPLPPNDDFLYPHISIVDNINTNKS